LVLLAVAACPAIASAQDVDSRFRIGVSGGIQTKGDTVSQNFTVTKNVEPATIAAQAPLDQAPMFDVGGWVRLFGRVGAGVAFSRISRSADATIDARIPHPFYFQQLRPINGTQGGVDEQETAVHIDLVVLAAATPTLEVSVFVGPTAFSATQDLVTDVSYTESYPFDTAAFSSAALAQQSESKVGFNAGADVTWTFSEHAGVGGLFRFSRAAVTYSAGAGNDVSVDLGGFQAAAGLRIRF
jgi:hypothetical protein